MKWNLVLTLISFAFAQKIYSQGRADSIIASDTYDTIVNNIKYKKISCYSPDMFHHTHYYGKLKFKNEKLDGEYLTTEDKCEPCYFYEYRQSGAIYSEGVFDGEECSIGYTIIYFSNGNKSCTFTKIADPNKSTGCPQVIDGRQTFYDRYGDSLFTQLWNHGKLTRQIPYTVHKNGDVVFQINERILLINDTIKVSEFEKIKLKPNSIKNPELAQGYHVSFSPTLRPERKNKLPFNNCRIDNLRDFSDKKLTECIEENFPLEKNMNLIIYIDHNDRNEMFEPHFLTLVE